VVDRLTGSVIAGAGPCQHLTRNIGIRQSAHALLRCARRPKGRSAATPAGRAVVSIPAAAPYTASALDARVAELVDAADSVEQLEPPWRNPRGEARQTR